MRPVLGKDSDEGVMVSSVQVRFAADLAT